MNRPEVTHSVIMQAHAARTKKLIGECGGVVLLLHDATELDTCMIAVQGPKAVEMCKGLTDADTSKLANAVTETVESEKSAR